MVEAGSLTIVAAAGLDYQRASHCAKQWPALLVVSPLMCILQIQFGMTSNSGHYQSVRAIGFMEDILVVLAIN